MITIFVYSVRRGVREKKIESDSIIYFSFFLYVVYEFEWVNQLFLTQLGLQTSRVRASPT
jgi:hypothetical protein